MQPRHQITVAGGIPESLGALPALAANLRWAWNPRTAALFDRLDEDHGRRSWRNTGRHPFDVVRRTTAARWIELAADHDFVGRVNEASAELAIDAPSWFGERSAGDASPLRAVAYFSPEFGITEALPQYSGGLGVLAGDHLKASSDLGVPVRVGALHLASSGWPRAYSPTIRLAE